MFRHFEFKPTRFLVALTLMISGSGAITYLNSNQVEIGETDITSLLLVLGGVVFYAGVLVLVSMLNSEKMLSIAIVFPSIVAVAIFVYGFIGWSIRVSLSKWQGLNPDFTWVGFENYINLFHDPRFMIDVSNTGIFTLLFIAGCVVIGLGLAILLDQRLKGEALFRGIFLFPMSISFIASGVVWGWLMNPATGDRTTGLNLIFKSLGADFLISTWHASPPPWGMAYTAIPAIWQLSGFTMALYLGGLRSIPDDLREAARVDGASEWAIYRHIIFPLLQPVTLSAVIILGHMSLKIFDLIVAIGNQNMRLDVPGIYMWQITFRANKYAVGAAIGELMLMSVAVLVVPYLIYSMRTEAEL